MSDVGPYQGGSGGSAPAVPGIYGDRAKKVRGYYGGSGTEWYLFKP